MQKLSPGTLILGIFAVLFGLVAAYAAKNYLKEKEVQAAEVQTFSVPMAVTDLPAERIITRDDIMMLRMTQQDIEKLNVPGPFMNKTLEIIGRQLRNPMARGQVFLIDSLYSRGTGPTVADRLGTGERAVTIPLTGSIASSGLINPGSIVDVLFRTTPNAHAGLPETTVTLLDRVRVLAVGRETFEGSVGSPAANGTVTLAVTSLQAKALGVVEGKGTFNFVLRNGDDTVAAGGIQPTTLEDLLGFESTKPFTTQMYRRGQLTTIIHNDGPPKYIHSAPYGMPVAGQAPDGSDKTAAPSTATPPLDSQASWQQTTTNKRAAAAPPTTTERNAVEGKF